MTLTPAETKKSAETDQDFDPLTEPYGPFPRAVRGLPLTVMDAFKKLVYQAALDRYGKNQECFASAETLAEDVGACERHTRRALHWLNDNGWIDIHIRKPDGQRQTTNKITFRNHPWFAEWRAEQRKKKRQKPLGKHASRVDSQVHPQTKIRVDSQSHPDTELRPDSQVHPELDSQVHPRVDSQSHHGVDSQSHPLTNKHESSSALTKLRKNESAGETRNFGVCSDRKRAARSSSFKPGTDFSNRADDDQNRSVEKARATAWPPQEFANPAEEIRAMVSVKVAQLRTKGVEANLLSERDEMEIASHLRNSGKELSDLVEKLREFMGNEWKNPVGLVKRTAHDLRGLTAKAPENTLSKPRLCIHCLGKQTIEARDGEIFACVCASDEFIRSNGLKRNEIVRNPRPELVPSGSAA